MPHIRIRTPEETLGVGREGSGEDVRHSYSLTRFTDHRVSRSGVRAENRPRNEAKLRGSQHCVGCSTSEKEDAAIDAAGTAIVEPQTAANAEALPCRANDVARPQNRYCARFAKEPERVWVGVCGSQYGNPESGHPPQQVLTLNEPACAFSAVAGCPQREPVADWCAAQFGERRIVFGEANRL